MERICSPSGVRRLRDSIHHLRVCLARRVVRGRRCGGTAMDGPREVPFHESANRPQLLMGGDRELILVSAILAAMLVFAVMKWWSILAGLVLWLTAVGGIAGMAKGDPPSCGTSTSGTWAIGICIPPRAGCPLLPLQPPRIGDEPCPLLNSARGG